MKEVGRLNQTPEFLQEKNGDLWLIEDERENMKVSYRIKEVVFSEKSPFQHVMILDSYAWCKPLP
jgi:spermidine synthase